mgnify:CR=1 FL=1
MAILNVAEVAAFLGIQEIRVERLARENLLVANGKDDVDPPAAQRGPCSKTVTSVQPRCVNSSASAQPTIPAPMMTTFFDI